MTTPQDGVDPTLIPNDVDPEHAERQRIKGFTDQLSGAVERATAQKVDMTVIVSTPEAVLNNSEPIYHHQGSAERMQPASMIKVAQVIFLASRPEFQNLTETDMRDPLAVNWSDFEPTDFIPGGGVYDQAGAETHASYASLLDDGLGEKSGNMALKVLLGRNSSDGFNAFWQDIAPTVRQKPKGDAGWFELENVSPSDMLQVMARVSTLPDTPFSRAIRGSLSGGSGREGTVSATLDNEDRPALLTKTGELPADDSDPFHIRHDMGVLDGMVYVVMSKSPNRRSVIAAKQAIEEIGASIAQEKGYSTKERTQHGIGRTALRHVWSKLSPFQG